MDQLGDDGSNRLDAAAEFAYHPRRDRDFNVGVVATGLPTKDRARALRKWTRASPLQTILARA